MDIDRLRRTEFPVTERYIYLNHAAVAPVSVSVRRAMDQIVRDVTDHGIAHITQWQDLVAAARRSAARLLGIGRSTMYRKLAKHGLSPGGSSVVVRQPSGSAGPSVAIRR